MTASSAVAAVQTRIRPMRSLALLSVAHAFNHAQAVLLPFVFLAIIDEYGVSVGAVAILAAVGSFASGMVQLSYAGLTRVMSRRRILGIGGIVFGGGFALQALAVSFATFADPEHRVAHRWLAAAPGRQWPPRRAVPARATRVRDQRPHRGRQRRHGRHRAHRRAAHRGGGLAWRLDRRWPARGRHRRRDPAAGPRAGTDRVAAVAGGTVRSAFRRILADHDLRWLFLTATLGGGGRGLGVVNLFVLIYLTTCSASTRRPRA